MTSCFSSETSYEERPEDSETRQLSSPSLAYVSSGPKERWRRDERRVEDADIPSVFFSTRSIAPEHPVQVMTCQTTLHASAQLKSAGPEATHNVELVGRLRVPRWGRGRREESARVSAG